MLTARYLGKQQAYLTHHQGSHSLSIALAKMYIGPILSQFGFVILKSLIIMTPQLITYRFLYRQCT